MINFKLNGLEAAVEEGSTLLEAAQLYGIKIPTLCNHKSLEPQGACRLCLVEVTAGGRPGLAASCAYMATDGLEIETHSERVLQARKLVIELLLLRCPDVQSIRELAEEIGIDQARYDRFEPDDDDCILCGLCVRICKERMGIGAIDFVNRGTKRKVVTPFDRHSPVCIACGACQVVCPTGAVDLSEITTKQPRPIASEFDMGLGQRGSIYIPFPQAIPKMPVIDRDTCMAFVGDACRSCENYCQAGAIAYDQQDEIEELEVGAVILAPGFDIFDPDLKKELGYDRYPNVVSSLQFERILSASGPSLGKVVRPSDGMTPKKVAFIQCVGSRDVESNYCSSICCMYATKEAIIAKEHTPDLECTIFFIDMRAFGKGFDAYYKRAEELGVRYVRCRPSSVREVPGTGNLAIRYRPDDGGLTTEEFDMVVLSTGVRPPRGVRDLATTFGIDLDAHGFAATDRLSPVESSKAGVYVCGPFSEPKDIPETVMEASASAAHAMAALSEARGTLLTQKTYPPERDVSAQDPRIGVFICHCGKNIGGVVDVPSLIESARQLPDVVHAEDNLYTCSTDSQQTIRRMIEEQDLNRVVVASCSPRTHEPLFRDTCREVGLNPYLFEMANIRDQCSWVHPHEPEAATAKADILIRMAVAKVRLSEPLTPRTAPVTPSALVIGGGIAGMTAALNLAEQGFPTYLVEKEKTLGGNLRHIHYLLEGPDPQAYLANTVEKVLSHPKITVYTGAQVTAFEGTYGSFRSTVGCDGATTEIEHGVVIVATGAEESKPTEYLYGWDPRVLTQREMEERLADGTLDIQDASSVVMIQCVGSRNEDRPYCSRICCQQAVKLALKIKEIQPETSVHVLYRDMRTYGFREAYYRKARQRGVVFLRYDEHKKPLVSTENGTLGVRVHDPILDRPVDLAPDLLVLAPAVVPRTDSEDISKLLKVTLNQERFFLEAHMKLRPIDFVTEGIFLCGLAHAPKTMDEAVAQASAAAARAATILSKERIHLEPTISEVQDENCDGCAYCIDPCPANAISLIEFMMKGAVKKVVEVNPAICVGCGSCQATCPKKGIRVSGFTLPQLYAQVDAALEV